MRNRRSGLCGTESSSGVFRFLVFVLLSVFLAKVGCEGKKGTHVRTEERVDPINLSLDDFIKENGVSLSDEYESLSDYPVWEDTSEAEVLDQALGEADGGIGNEFGSETANGLKKLAVDTAQAYSDVIQTRRGGYKNESFVSGLYNEEHLADSKRVSDGLNKTRNAILLGRSVAGIREADRETVRRAFPEDFYGYNENSLYEGNNSYVPEREREFQGDGFRSSASAEDLLKETRMNHLNEHEDIQKYLAGLNITSPIITSKVGDIYDSYVLLSASAIEYGSARGDTQAIRNQGLESTNSSKSPFSIPLKPYHVWEGLDKLWNTRTSKATTPSPKTKEVLDKIDDYNSYVRWKREEPFRVYDMWYDALKERREAKDSLRRESISQRDRVLEERMRKQRAFYSPAKDTFDDIGNATEMAAKHIDNRFGQVFNEVTELMDEESRKREQKYYDDTVTKKVNEFCLVYPDCCGDMSRCPEFVYNYIRNARILF